MSTIKEDEYQVTKEVFDALLWMDSTIDVDLPLGYENKITIQFPLKHKFHGRTFQITVDDITDSKD